MDVPWGRFASLSSCLHALSVASGTRMQTSPMQGTGTQQSGLGGGGACCLTALLLWLSLQPLRAQDVELQPTFPVLPTLPTVVTLLSVPPQDKPPLSDVCGRTRFTGKVFGGERAGPERWPWQASLLYKGMHICGAVLIDTTWVATTAHCFQRSRKPSYYRILLGYNELSNPTNYSRQMTVNKIIIQENYNKFYRQGSDIALLQLHYPVEFNSHILPACILENTTMVPLDRPCWISGWGMLTEDTFLPAPYYLQEARVTLIENQQCESFFQSPESINTQFSAIKEDMLCTMDLRQDKTSVCRGDSGGPLVCILNDSWYVVGLASWHGTCLHPITSPSIFTKVSYYANWIKDQKEITPDANISMVPPEEKPPSLTGWRNQGTVLQPTVLSALLSAQTLLLQLTWFRSLRWAHSTLPSSLSHHSPH